jgi:hypothetical protein
VEEEKEGEEGQEERDVQGRTRATFQSWPLMGTSTSTR